MMVKLERNTHNICINPYHELHLILKAKLKVLKQGQIIYTPDTNFVQMDMLPTTRGPWATFLT